MQTGDDAQVRRAEELENLGRLVVADEEPDRLVVAVAVARFTRTLGTMLSSGVPILDALEIVAATAGNTVVEKGLRVVRQKISDTVGEGTSQITTPEEARKTALNKKIEEM